MPSARYFAQCPPFPSDIPVVDLPVLSLKRLEECSNEENAKVFRACRHDGFFLLGLQDSELGEALLKHAEAMFDLANTTFDLDESELEKYAFAPPKSLLGYKGTGKSKLSNGKPDRLHFYTIEQDDMLGTGPPRRNPETIEAQRSQCAEYIRCAYGAIAVILNGLDDQLGLPKGALASLSSLERLSSTSLRMLSVPPQQEAKTEERQTAHTDIGLMTLLFNVAGGLQILPAGLENIDENWHYIQPKQGCALINVGDALVQLTGGVLRSVIHRVATAPGEQKTVPRISLAYLVRPARGVLMRRLRSEAIPSNSEDEHEKKTVDEWAAERVFLIHNGKLKPQSTGGINFGRDQAVSLPSVESA